MTQDTPEQLGYYDPSKVQNRKADNETTANSDQETSKDTLGD